MGSQLLRVHAYADSSTEERMCCMGFAAMAFGATRLEIMGRSTWSVCANRDLSSRDRDRSSSVQTIWFMGLYQINDDPGVPDDGTRVQLLNEELERLGEDFRFALKEAEPRP